MKKVCALLFLIVAFLGLTGCGGAASNAGTAKNAPKAEAAAVKTSTATAAKGKKILVAYYSYSKDKNTKAVVEQIKAATGADIVEITPKVPYSDDYDKVVAQGKDEVNRNYQPEITTVVKNWKDYDTVILGSPIWWFHVAPPVATFMAKNDFSGKQVALFTTHGGYGAGESDGDLSKNCKNAKILKSYSAPGKDVAKDKAKVEAWLKEIGVE